MAVLGLSARNDGVMSGAPLHRERQAVWGAGVLAGVLALGPALGPGSLLNLDLITSSDMPVPAGAWGLGPELPRRVPLYVLLSWVTQVLSGDVVQKGVMLTIVAVAFAGMARRAEPLPVVLRMGVGALYALNPFLLTRLEVGHHTLALAAALLPWALPTLLAPGRSGSRLLRWSALLGLAGVQGAAVMATVVLAAAVCGRARRFGVALVAMGIGQLPWIVPGVVVALQSGGAAAAADFPTHLEGVLHWPALLVGAGFWQQALELGWSGAAVDAAAGCVIAGLAALGWRGLPDEARAPLAIAGAIGLVVAVASALPAVDGIWTAATSNMAGAAFREGHRILPLLQLPLYLAAAHGVERVAQGLDARRAEVARAALGAGALALVAPALWGFGGAVAPVRWPQEYAEARAAVRADPGTVLVLPWHLYMDFSWAGGRRVLNPMPLYLGVDTLTSSDPELSTGRSERGDPRERAAARIAEEVRRGRAVGDALRQLGVRWVVLLEESPADEYRAVEADPALRPVVRGGELQLWEVRGWQGPALADGRPVPVEPLLRPLARLGAGDRSVTVHRAGGWGWRRGTERARTTPLGHLEVPAGSGPLWYPPAVVVVAGDLITLGALAATVRRGKRPLVSAP